MCKPESSARRASNCSTGSSDYTFIAEQAFADEAVARDTARVFCDELVRNGTTTALVFCSVHAGSVDALFEEAERRNLRLIAGKVLMDREAPPALTDTARSGYEESKKLIAKWHGRGRALYAITPRFAVTSTPEQLDWPAACGASIPRCSCRPTSPRTGTRSRACASSFPSGATISMSTPTMA